MTTLISSTVTPARGPRGGDALDPRFRLEEMRRAAAALSDGMFRSMESWLPKGDAVLVSGVGGGVGATTVALGMAEAHGHGRVVETAPVHATGLADATTAELGERGPWRRGTRRSGKVIIDRLGQGSAWVPVPRSSAAALDIVDSACRGHDLSRRDGWLDGLSRQVPTVLIARATVPSIASLNVMAERSDDRCVAVVVGSRCSRWPAEVRRAASEHMRAMDADQRLFTVPLDRRLVHRGITPDDLPSSITSACRPVLDRALQLVGKETA